MYCLLAMFEDGLITVILEFSSFSSYLLSGSFFLFGEIEYYCVQWWYRRTELVAFVVPPIFYISWL